MNKRTRKAFLMHSKHEDYKQRIKKAKQIIHECYINFSSPYVSYSGGKDSTVLTHMVLQEEPLANIWHWDYGEALMPREYEKECMENLEKLGAKKVYTNKRKGNKNDTSSGYKQFFQQINSNKKKYGWDIGFVGVRQEESTRRKNMYVSDYMKDCCYPIRALSVEDVWAYILSYGLPYHSTYDVLGDYVGWDEVRFVTFDDPEFERLSGYHERIFL